MAASSTGTSSTEGGRPAVQVFARSTWRARYPDGFGPAPLPARAVWLHHTDMVAPGLGASFEQDVAAVQAVERVGQQRFGGGISYTWLVMPSGRVFEGHSIDRRGAHTRGQNTSARAICLHGRYQDTEPTAAMLQAVIELLREGVLQGWWSSAQLAGGHRDAPDAHTACPGDRAWRHIPAINQAADVVSAARPPVSPQEDALTPEQDRMLREVHHELTVRLPNRRGPRGSNIPDGGADTLLGYAANTDGAGYRASWALVGIDQRLDELAALLRTQAGRDAGGLGDPEAFAQRVAAELVRKLTS